MKKIKVDKVILYYMDRVDPDGNPYRFYVYKEMAEDGTKNGWDEDRVGLESSEFDYYEVEYPTVEENKGATIFISHLDSCLGWDNEEEEK